MTIWEKRPELLHRLQDQSLPKHVGIIMDGNGRWAQSRSLPRAMGHRAGVERLRSVVRLTSDLGIKVLTLYAFSTENWKRPTDEVDLLMKLLMEFMTREIKELDANNVKIQIMGDLSRMSKLVQGAITSAMAKTALNTGLLLNIALNYGGRSEIVQAAKSIALDVLSGLPIEEINEALFEDKLYTAKLPPLDLLIRTSGEQRLSNFMLYQSAYAELFFTNVHWPDFDDDQYMLALEEYQHRSRRFGGL